MRGINRREQYKMADVEMPDVGSAAPTKGKAVAKTSKAGGSADVGSEKKRFEVKKVMSSVNVAGTN